MKAPFFTGPVQLRRIGASCRIRAVSSAVDSTDQAMTYYLSALIRQPAGLLAILLEPRRFVAGRRCADREQVVEAR